MKHHIVLLVLFCVTASAQFKPKPASEQPRVADSFLQPSSASDWFNLFDPSKFTMRHSYSASYSSGGGVGIALQRYTNSMFYEFAPNLGLRVDLSAQNSPYSTLDHRLQSQFNRVALSRAELTYQPWENTLLRVSYREVPYSMYGYYRPFGGMFDGLDRYDE
ncbi:MAG: hypothetical protein F9K22_03370 [Bacteroidetes bacterium]|nr:MAG: hypothetical protein F9K22_03370 [Bacteroidota bacterium]